MSVTQPQDPPGAPPAGDRHLRRVLEIWVAASVIGIALTFVFVPLISPASGSDVMGFANLTDLLFTVLAVPVAMFVWVFIFYSVVVFRERTPKDTPVDEYEDGPPLEARPRVQIAWLGVTGGLAIFLVGWGMIGLYKQTTSLPPHPLVVQVTGQQWAWTYDYPALGVQSSTLVLPKGRPVQFRITSDDVLHGFVVDGLGVAMDANPGWWSTAPTVTPTKLGNYATRCVELCGLYHSYMWSPVKVVPAASFTSWVTANGGHPDGSGTKAGT
jgi:cytochrome c oxidase subunit 2